ncbi:hypothetical protein IF1G_10529 [Cordyceps javanica]|uniref:Uncharacterized protein n=1 Tax=Cordyceps javanica TaxID=43265 RepID=A0A545VL35_9HYPO|nr:hypothetical protein IF1G_10529 [Cordyceps javanica]TQW02425.1 hypothetical protein IF2G_10025 [Cordyceps javanica]
MKYSALVAVTLLAASSLGMPELFSGASKAAPGQIIVTNNMNRPLRLEKGEGQTIILHQGQTVQVAAAETSADLWVSEQNAKQRQAEVSYSGGDEGTYNFSIMPAEGSGGFPGAIEAIPLSPRPSPRCHPLVWYPGQGNTQQSTCQDRTPLRVFFREAHHLELV